MYLCSPVEFEVAEQQGLAVVVECMYSVAEAVVVAVGIEIAVGIGVADIVHYREVDRHIDCCKEVVDC